MERIDSRYQSQGTLGKFSQIDSFTRSYQRLQYHHPSYTALVRSNLTVVSRKLRDRQTGLFLRVVSQSPGPVIPNRIATTVDRILMPMHLWRPIRPFRLATTGFYRSLTRIMRRWRPPLLLFVMYYAQGAYMLATDRAQEVWILGVGRSGTRPYEVHLLEGLW